MKGHILTNLCNKYNNNYKEAKFQIGEKVIVVRVSPGDPAAERYANCIGKVVGHYLPYALVQMNNNNTVVSILERDLERYLG